MALEVRVEQGLHVLHHARRQRGQALFQRRLIVIEICAKCFGIKLQCWGKRSPGCGGPTLRMHSDPQRRCFRSELQQDGMPACRQLELRGASSTLEGIARIMYQGKLAVDEDGVRAGAENVERKILWTCGLHFTGGVENAGYGEVIGKADVTIPEPELFTLT